MAINTQNRILRKLQAIYFGLKLSCYGLLGLPAQTRTDRRLFKKILDHFKGPKIRVFEWGSGFSSIYYSEYLRKKGIPFEWHSIDNNRVWHEKIRQMVKDKRLDSHITLYLSEFPPFWEKPEWGKLPPGSGAFAPKSEGEEAYIDFPKRLNKKFDLILIDARFRRRCLRAAKEAVERDGIVILHDAEKEHYHHGLEIFPFRTFVSSGCWYPLQASPNRVWLGSLTVDISGKFAK